MRGNLHFLFQTWIPTNLGSRHLLLWAIPETSHLDGNWKCWAHLRQDSTLTSGNPVSCRSAMPPCCSNKENCAAKIITDGKTCFWALGTHTVRNHNAETSPSSQGDHKSLQMHCKLHTVGCCLGTYMSYIDTCRLLWQCNSQSISLAKYTQRFTHWCYKPIAEQIAVERSKVMYRWAMEGIIDNFNENAAIFLMFLPQQLWTVHGKGENPKYLSYKL